MGWEEKITPRITGECKIFLHIGHGWPLQGSPNLPGWDYTFGDFMNNHYYDVSGLQCNGGLFYGSAGCWTEQNNETVWLPGRIPGTAVVLPNPIDPIISSQRIPGLPLSKEKMKQNELIKQVEKALQAIWLFSQRLCENRSCLPDGLNEGDVLPSDFIPAQYSRCDSIKIVLEMDKTAQSILLNKDNYQKKQAVFNGLLHSREFTIRCENGNVVLSEQMKPLFDYIATLKLPNKSKK